MLAGGPAYDHDHDSGCGPATHDAEDRGNIPGPIYRGLLAAQLTALEGQISDPTLRPVPGYRGWVLANVLSFLEGGHYGKQYVRDQSDVEREGMAHLRGAAFGLGTIGGQPGPTWRWFVPLANSLNRFDLALGVDLRAKTAQVWDAQGRPQSGEDVDGEEEWDTDSGDAEDAPLPHVKRAQDLWNKLFGADKSVGRVTIFDYGSVPSDAVRELGYDAWTNSATKVYVADIAQTDRARRDMALETTLRHEAVHVRQFKNRGRPDTYAKVMAYELEAYQDGQSRLEAGSKTLSSLTRRTKDQDAQLTIIDDLLDAVEATATTLQKGVDEGAKKRGAGQEGFYRHFLISRCLLPYHRAMADLYVPPKDQRNPSAAESVDLPDADWTEADLDGEVAELEDGDRLADLVALELAGPAPDGDEGWDDDLDDHGAAEFVGREHKEIGDAGSGHEQSSIPFGNPAQPLSFGDVVSMAGDYFDTYEEMRDLGRTAAGRSELEWARWHCLGFKSQGVPEPTTTDMTKKRVVDRYLLLAGRNLSHFSAGGSGWQAYSAWHGKAIADALEAGQTSDAALWRRALTKEAFGDHFLTDIFSAGHVRTPRREIRDWYDRHLPGTSDAFVSYMAKFIFDRLDDRQQLPPLLWWFGWVTKSIMGDRIRELGGEAVNSFSLGDIVALALHDLDNKSLVVVSDVGPDGHAVPGGHTWTAVGDAHLARSRQGADTKAMATAAVIASLRDLERVRGVGVKLGAGTVSLGKKADEVRKALGASGFAARAYVPRESPVAGANPPYNRSDGTRAALDWRWGQLGPTARAAVDETVKTTISAELRALAGNVADPITAPFGIRVYGIQNAFLAFVRHLRSDGIGAIEKAVGKPAT